MECTFITETPPPEIDRGTPGASAAREWRRRHDRRETQIRDGHKRVGGLILALSSEPQSTTAWATGAIGEQKIGRNLDGLRTEGFPVLHDRRIPGTKANIDHLIIGASGVFVVDTKNYAGRVEQRDVGGWFSTDLRLYIGGRDRTKLLGGMNRQVEAVRSILACNEMWRAVPVIPVILCVSDDNWSLFGTRPLRFGSVYVVWAKALGKLERPARNGFRTA